MAFAEGTTVPVEKTRAEIEALVVRKHGASMFTSGMTIGKEAAISFAMHGRLVRFRLPLPSGKDPGVYKRAQRMSRYTWTAPEPNKLAQAIEEENRRRWRCLLLAIKAKLTIVESGIKTFEEEFLAEIVTEGNLTVYERIKLQESGVRMLSPMAEAP